MDETHLDAKTPAHIFAYKALRGIFVNSPESSPVRPQHLYDYNEDKENTPTPHHGSRFTTVPVKTKRKELDVDMIDAFVTFTPKKQKTAPVSPSKSILKKPNAPTPRRAGLRDATVTFKDLRKSVSPELARKLDIAIQSDSNVIGITSTKAATVFVEPARTSKTETATKSSRSVASRAVKPTLPANVHDDILSAYKTQTEKEVRRLIKYGQKWKDQAKKQEVRNVELEFMVAELRKENERLERKLAQSEEAEKSVRQNSARVQHESQSKRTVIGQHPEEDLCEVLKGVYLRPSQPDETLKLEAKIEEAYGSGTPVQKTKTALSQPLKPRQVNEQSDGELPISASPPLKTNASTSRAQTRISSQLPTTKDLKPESQDRPSTHSKSHDLRTAQAEIPLRSVSDSSVPDEGTRRRLAARARLDAKRAQRLGSMPTALSGSKPPDNEESEVDWAGL